MAQFQVPQFIETEDKIVGPLTLRQALYIAAAGLIGFLTFFILKTFLWIILMAIVGTIATLMAFVKFNGQPMHKALIAMLNYVWRPRFYLWKSPTVRPSSPQKEKIEPTVEIPASAAREDKKSTTRPTMPTATEEQPTTPVPKAAPRPEAIQEMPQKPRLKSLWFKLQTSAAGIRPAAKERRPEEHYAFIQKITGEKEKVRRIDYR